MNTIDTSNIVDPNQDQPFFGKSLAFLQTATKQVIQGLVESIVGDSFDGSKAYVISRLNPYGTNQYTDGWVFYNYELYYCPGKSTTTAFSNVPVLTITDLSDSSVDPTQFSNGVNFNVHRLRTMVLSDAISGSGTVDLSACIYVNSPWINPTLLNSWANYGTPWAVSGYRIEGSYLSMRGFVVSGSSGTVAFTLPIGYRPDSLKTILTSCGDDTGRVAIIDIDTAGSVVLSYAAGAAGVSLDGIRIPLN